MVFEVIDDDEWFELSLELSATMRALPPGSTLIEALLIPPFRAAIKASGTEFPSVLTLPFASGQKSPQAAVDQATRLAEHARKSRPAGALTIAVTQTDDGDTISIVVSGLPGERCSFASFELRPGSHNIDVGFEVLRMLRGWAIKNRPALGGLTTESAA